MDYAQFLIDDQYLINYVIYRFKNKTNGKDPEFRAKHITNILKVAGINRKSVYQYDLEGNFIKEWYSNHSVCEYLYGSKRKGNLRRDILSNNRKGKLGFTKKGSIWSYYSPNERRAY